MCKQISLIILLISVIYGVFAADGISKFKLCKQSLSSSEFNACLKDAIQDALLQLKDGVPELNLPRLHPLEIPSITIGEGSGAVSVVQNFKDVKIYNIPFAKVEKVEAKFNTTWMSIYIEVSADETRLEAIYNLDGKLLLLPITGTGDANVKFLNLKMSLQFLGDIIEKKGKQYLKLVKSTVDIVPSKISFKYDNLFNGDERLGKEINKVFNENWYEIWTDVKGQYFDAFALIMQNYADKLFRSVPVDELFPLK